MGHLHTLAGLLDTPRQCKSNDSIEKFSKLGDGVDLKNTVGVRLCFAVFSVKSGVKSHPYFLHDSKVPVPPWRLL